MIFNLDVPFPLKINYCKQNAHCSDLIQNYFWDDSV